MTTTTTEGYERTRRRRALLVVVVVALLLWVGTVVAWAIVDMDRDDVVVVGGGSQQAPAVASPDVLSISGALTMPLRPGSAERLDLVIVNDTDATLAVSGLTVRIADVVAPNAGSELGCSAADFAVEQSTFGFDLDASTATSLSGAGAATEQLPLLSMLDTDVDQSGCVGATLALEYAAVGTPA